MSIYEYIESNEDPRKPHDSGKFYSKEQLASFGVELYSNVTQPTVDAIATKRGFPSRDEVTVSRESLGDKYDSSLAKFFEEHLHEDEEIRFILDGAGYFDVRGPQDKWVRIKVVGGDLVVLPKGIWHRFTVDDSDYIKALRLYKAVPKWTPIARSSENEQVETRKEYEKMVAEGEFSTNIDITNMA